MDLARCTALATIPAAHTLGVLTYVQLLLTAIVVATADIGFRAASGAHLKTLLPAADLLRANARLESTTWTTTVIGRTSAPPRSLSSDPSRPCSPTR